MNFPRSLPIPPRVLDIARRLEDSGHETWCVGGAVRDNLLDIPNHDFDLATAAPPDEVRRLFRRTVPVGIDHGTVAVLDDDDGLHEVTTFRRDVRTDGRHAEVAFGVSLEEDLARRDFTINAIAYHPLRGEWRDPFEGAADLDRKLVRAVGDPARRFREDYLRIVRALRFAARFAFTIESATWEAARREAAGLRMLSAERVRDEWFKGLASARKPSELVRLWMDVGAAAIWLPEIAKRATRAVERDQQDLDRFEPADPVLMTAHLSADPVATLSRLKCSNVEIDRARRVARHRDAWPDPNDPRAVRRWMAAAGPVVDDLVAIWRVGGRGPSLDEAVLAERASGAALSLGELAVTGEDVLAAGAPRGPAVGQVLRTLLDEVLDDPDRNTRDYLLGRIAVHVSRFPSHAPGEEPA